MLQCELGEGKADLTMFFALSGNDGSDGLLQAGRTYTVTFRYQATATRNVYFGYTPDGASTVLSNAGALSATAENEWKEAVVTFTVDAAHADVKKHLTLYSGGSETCTVLLDDVVIECTAVAA